MTSLAVLLLKSASPEGPLAVNTAVQRLGERLFLVVNPLALMVTLSLPLREPAPGAATEACGPAVPESKSTLPTVPEGQLPSLATRPME